MVDGSALATVVVPTRGGRAALKHIARHVAPLDLPLVVLLNHREEVDAEGWSRIVAADPTARAARVEGGGVARARNLALRLVTTDVVVFIDDDAVPTPASVARLLDALEGPSVGVATGRVGGADPEEEPDDSPVGLDRGVAAHSYGRDDRATLTPMTSWQLGVGAAFAVRRSMIDAAAVPPAFDESLSNGRFCGGAEDTDFFLQCLRADVGVAYVPTATFAHAAPLTARATRQKMRRYARADGAFYAKWAGDLTLLDAALDLVDWGRRLGAELVQPGRRRPNVTSALAQEPLQKAVGAVWWRLAASR